MAQIYRFRRRRRVSLALQAALLGGTTFLAAVGVSVSGVSMTDVTAATKQFVAGVSGSCAIKGNISVRGERIYHVPGQRYYGATAINPLAGERWFCTESEARSAGWRRSKV